MPNSPARSPASPTCTSPFQRKGEERIISSLRIQGGINKIISSFQIRGEVNKIISSPCLQGEARRGLSIFLALMFAGLFAFGLFSAAPVYAVNCSTAKGIELLRCGLSGAAQEGGLPGTANELTTAEQIGQTVGKILNPILALLGTVFVVLVIYSGIQWMISAGNPEKVGEARNLIIHAAIGLGIVTGAYIILNFVVGILGQIT